MCVRRATSILFFAQHKIIRCKSKSTDAYGEGQNDYSYSIEIKIRFFLVNRMFKYYNTKLYNVLTLRRNLFRNNSMSDSHHCQDISIANMTILINIE